MRLWFLAGLCCVFVTGWLGGQDLSASGQKVIPVDLEVESSSFFTDMVVSAVVRFPEEVTPVENVPGEDSGISMLGLKVEGAVGSITFQPVKTGLVTIPGFEFRSQSAIYRTQPKQILVSAPNRGEAMTFAMTPAKLKVYVGEPLRFDVVWKVDLPANQVRSLKCFPDIFSRQDVKIVIPRCTAPENEQIGLPFGGRRIVAQRVIAGGDGGAGAEHLGTVTFPFFVKFDQPGRFEVPSTRLEIAHLKGRGGVLAPYAVFFNNGLFEPRTALEAFDRFFVESQPFMIEVLPLPGEGRTENFSGLFAPCRIEAAIRESSITVGDVLELNLRVYASAPHGMLELPGLETQRSLRGRFRAGSEYGRTWHEDGTEFSGRIRVLTTEVTGFPSLQFQIFDPEAGRFAMIQTEPAPFQVNPRNGSNYFDIRTMTREITLTDHAAGIWQNAAPGSISAAMNQVIGFFAENIWFLLILGPVSFLLLLPGARERRRRALNAVYKAQAESFERFLKIPEKSGAKWRAFREFLATGFSMSGEAWTSGDAGRRLREMGLDAGEVEKVMQIHSQMDEAEFSREKPRHDLPGLDDLARKLFEHFRKAALSVVLICGLFLTGEAFGGDWEAAEEIFARALESPAGLPATDSLFTHSALKYESAAADKGRAGAAWFNAGNAWFKVGEMGRAISCYRQARIYRPFDRTLRDNLQAARALCVDVVDDKKGIFGAVFPVRWLAPGLVLITWGFWGALLFHLGSPCRASRACLWISTLAFLVTGVLMLISKAHSGKQGVVIVESVPGRKGPAYRYELAFNEPLHNGLEFETLEERGEWLQIRLKDRRQCWVPTDQVRRIFIYP